MKELARKGNAVVHQHDEYLSLLHKGKVYTYSMFIPLEELSDLKDCISQATAKKWEKRRRVSHSSIYYGCPDCNYEGSVSMNFCPNCGIKLEGVGE